LSDDPDIGLADARQLAADVFVLGFPLVLMDVVRRAHPIELNRILQLVDDAAALAPGLTDEGVRTVRASAWIDVGDEPVVLHLPHMKGRYFSLTLVNIWGEPFASLGSRTGDDTGCDLALTGPRWRGELAGDLKARRSASPAVWAVSRITANSAADRELTEALAGRQWLAPLNGIGGPAPIQRLEPPATSCVQQVMDMTPEMFRHRLNLLVGRASQGFLDPALPPIHARLQALDKVWRDPCPDMLRVLGRGFTHGAAAIRAAAAFARESMVGGWRRISAPIDPVASPLARAARVFADLGGPAPDDVLSLACDRDEAGRAFSGAERYRIHFPRGGTPPVEAFWSLFVVTPSPRGGGLGSVHRGISDRNDLSANPDGSVDLIIQHDAPGGPAVNWLPTPAGDFTLNMRLHWPKTVALNGEWRMPAVERLGTGFARRAEGRAPPTGRPPPHPSDALRPARSPWRFPL
jgi:hypothetical protein